jgi:hypothetical protein
VLAEAIENNFAVAVTVWHLAYALDNMLKINGVSYRTRDVLKRIALSQINASSKIVWNSIFRLKRKKMTT